MPNIREDCKKEHDVKVTLLKLPGIGLITIACMQIDNKGNCLIVDPNIRRKCPCEYIPLLKPLPKEFATRRRPSLSFQGEGSLIPTEKKFPYYSL